MSLGSSAGSSAIITDVEDTRLDTKPIEVAGDLLCDIGFSSGRQSHHNYQEMNGDCHTTNWLIPQAIFSYGWRGAIVEGEKQLEIMLLLLLLLLPLPSLSLLDELASDTVHTGMPIWPAGKN